MKKTLEKVVVLSITNEAGIYQPLIWRSRHERKFSLAYRDHDNTDRGRSGSVSRRLRAVRVAVS